MGLSFHHKPKSSAVKGHAHERMVALTSAPISSSTALFSECLEERLKSSWDQGLPEYCGHLRILQLHAIILMEYIGHK